MRPLQAEIIKALGVQATIDPETEVRRSVDFLKAYLKKTLF
ncbi:NH(3)-dependent NAD(+) synthetase [Lacticaseibacillus paracasei]|nr:NH(3)-dependent NAD(+) synthetase [Lacticaseibacillus paracasei]